MIPARSSLRHGDGHDFKNGLRKAAVGLDLGRRLLVVLKNSAAPVEKPQAIRVVDHGEQQKEALRRLFDAQVLLQSYEEQLHAKDEQLCRIQVCVKKAIRESSADHLREPALIESLGLSEEDLQEEGIVAVEQKPGTSKVSRFEAMLDQSFENQKWEEKQDRERRARELQASGGVLAARTEPESDLSWFKVPYWLKSDEETREMIHNIKQHFLDEMNAKGHFDHNMFHEHLWQCGLPVAQHWAGSPNEELIRQAEAAEKKARSVQREALQETSMLRQHIKRVERKYKELQSNAAKMQKAMSTMASQLREARETAAMFGVELPAAPNDASHRRPSIFPGFAGTAGGAKAHLIQPSPGAGAGSPSKGSDRRGSSSAASDAGGLPDFADLAPHQGPGTVSPLHADDTLEIMADQMQLEEMDNEIFEPLNQFDDDLKDLMIDCITEKVRRILSLDPSKYKNGRLPFGLKPHKGIAFGDDDSNLEEELEKMRELYDRLKEENEQQQRQLEAARAAAERWRLKYMELRDKQPEPQEASPTQISRPSSVKPQETVQAAEPAPAPVVKGLSDEEVRRLLEAQEKDFKAKISALEQKIKMLEEELKKQKVQMDKAEAKAAKAAQTAEEERQRRETMQKEQEDKEKKQQKPPAETDSAALKEALDAQRRAEAQAAELRQQLTQWVEATRQTMETALRAFVKLATITGHKIPAAELKFMQGFANAADPAAADVLRAMRDASPKFEVWVAEALAKYKASFAKDAPPAPASKPQEAAVVQEETETPKGGARRGDPNKGQEPKRIAQKPQVAPVDAGSNVVSTEDNFRMRVGLEDLLEPGVPKDPPVLKGVFERLYSDAVQRIERYGLIRQQMLLANKAYAAVVEAVSASEQEPCLPPDFERLNDTTDATIRGMWYHTEYLFRRACEYAMAQGVEASLIKAQRSLVSDLEADGERGQDELKAPRKERSVRRDRVRGFKEELKAGLPKPRRGGEESTPFMSYMAALREVQGELAKEVVKESFGEKRRTGDGFPKTLKDACADRQIGMATSRSLPALPKGRSLWQGFQADGDGSSPLKAKMAATMA